ncbi:MAG: C39 family peptidase [Oscillospiraceae bacterium]|nr:C39 family peptidase [Oscillospiraceae bacterium]
MNTEEKIWTFLKGQGLTDAGVAGLMGNLYAESGLRSNNLQNSYEGKLGMADAEYTELVDKGSYTNFVRDSAGYGLCQWTYWSRKEALLAYAKAAGKSIGDLDMQLGFLMKELSSSYKAVLNVLKTAISVRAASDAVLLQFERPADQSETAKARRASYGQKYFDVYAAKIAATGGTKMNKKPVSYLQTDARWKNKPYRVKGENSTIGDSGCGPTAAAMLLSTLTGKTITPEDTCKWSVDHGYKALGNGTYYAYFAPQFAAYGIKCWQLNWVNAYHNPKATSFDEVVKYLKQGYYAIALMKAGTWTSGGHFVVLWWVDDKVRINDPASTRDNRLNGNLATFRNEAAYFWIVDAREYNNSGKLVDGSVAEIKPENVPQAAPGVTAERKATGVAKSFDKALAGTYKVTAGSGLHIRNVAGSKTGSMIVLPGGTTVQNYGYYTAVDGVKWLYIQVTYQGVKYTGFSSGAYLKKV